MIIVGSFLFLFLIGWGSEACFANQSQSLAMQNQSKRELLFDT